MIDSIRYFIMVPMVYFTFAWLIFWIVVKIVRTAGAPSVPPTLRIFPEGKDPEDTSTGGLLAAIWDALSIASLRSRKPVFWGFLMVFHIAAAVLILAHLDMLPQINILASDNPHMIGNGAVGLAITLCTLYFLLRRFGSPLREISVPADYLLLFLLLCVLVSGDIISWGNSWSEDGFVITKQDFGGYLAGLFSFTFNDPAEQLQGAHYSVVAVHVLLANLFLLILPFSKVMQSFFAIPMNALRRG